MKILFLLFLVNQFIWAEEVLYELNDVNLKKESKKDVIRGRSGNLPRYFAGRGINGQKLAAIKVIQPSKNVQTLKYLKLGETLDGRVDHSIIAFPDEKAPVVAIVKNFKFIGESKLEPNSKQIFINFNRVIHKNTPYPVDAVGLNELGQPGLVGKYHSRELKYFGGEFVSNTVAAYFDALVPRKHNPYGQVIEDNSVDSAVKKGLSAGALSSADRFRKKLMKVPEFSELNGPVNLKILILGKSKN